MDFRNLVEEELSSTIGIMKSFNWKDPNHYIAWSAQTYYYVHHSTRLLALAASRCPLEHNNFHHRFAEHIVEERGHESLSKNDMKVLNASLHQVDELPETKAMYQSQYYWIEHVSPYALFGYILALEALSVHVGGDIHKEIVSTHGAKAASFLKVHAEEDIDHLEELYKWISKLDNATQMIVEENFKFSKALYENMIVAVSKAESVKTVKAA